MTNEPTSGHRDNPLWDRIQLYMDDPKHRYRPLAADLARETGISEQVLSKWKAKASMPKPHQLLQFSSGTGIPYADLVLAMLKGQGYLPQYPGSELVISIYLQRFLEATGRALIESEAEVFVDGERLSATELFRLRLTDIREEQRAAGLSVVPGTTEDPIAAHEDGSIGGEQDDRNDT